MLFRSSASACYRSTPYYLLPEIESTAYTSSVTGGYIFAPVSYTHLGKITEIIEKLTVNVEEASVNMQKSAESADKQNEMIAVSYTHLDVYKRQVLYCL